MNIVTGTAYSLYRVDLLESDIKSIKYSKPDAFNESTNKTAIVLKNNLDI